MSSATCKFEITAQVILLALIIPFIACNKSDQASPKAFSSPEEQVMGYL